MALLHLTARSAPPTHQPGSARAGSTTPPARIVSPTPAVRPTAGPRPGGVGPAGGRFTGGRSVPARPVGSRLGAGGGAGSPGGAVEPAGGAPTLPPSVARVAARTRLSAELLAAILEVDQRTRATLDDIERADALAERLLIRRGHRLRAAGGIAGPAAPDAALGDPATARPSALAPARSTEGVCRVSA